MNACATKINKIACDLCVHECDGKIMMYNFNIRRNIAQQKKKEKDKMNIECAREKKTNNKDIHRQIEKKNFLFTLVNEKHFMIYK